MKYLITGCAGFIGFSVALKLLKNRNEVIGIDNINSYYSKSLKLKRLKVLNKKKKFKFYKIDCSNKKILSVFKNKKIDVVIHLAAEVGVRNSLKYPKRYYDNNIKSFFNILELTKLYKAKLIFASSSSVYGKSKNNFFSEDDDTSHPLSFYAATKKCNEIMAHAYSATYNLNMVGVRFFNVYGPWGRPDMSIYKFTSALHQKKTIFIYGDGKQIRDFTYIDDAVNLIEKIIQKKINKKNNFNIYNTGKGECISLNNLVNLVSKINNLKPKIIKIEKQIGDLPFTNSSNKKVFKELKYIPKVDLNTGIKNFVRWYKEYHK